MQVFVKFLDGTTLTLDVNHSTTISELKQLVYEKVNIPPEEQRLVFSNQRLEQDDCGLTDYHIQNHSTVDILLRLSGGGGRRGGRGRGGRGGRVGHAGGRGGGRAEQQRQQPITTTTTATASGRGGHGRGPPPPPSPPPPEKKALPGKKVRRCDAHGDECPAVTLLSCSAQGCERVRCHMSMVSAGQDGLGQRHNFCCHHQPVTWKPHAPLSLSNAVS